MLDFSIFHSLVGFSMSQRHSYLYNGTFSGLAHFVDIVLSQATPLFGLLKLLLGLAIFSQVYCSNLLCFFNLLFVRLYLLLQFINQLGDAILVILVLISLEHEFFHTSLSFGDTLMEFSSCLNSSVELHFNLSCPCLKFNW